VVARPRAQLRRSWQAAPVDTPPRAAWKVALYAFLITLGLSAGLGFAAAIASGAIHRAPGRAGEQYGRAVFPFILIVTIAAYVIQRTRLTKP